MTPSSVDRVLQAFNDFRVEIARELAGMQVSVGALTDHETRLRVLEAKQATANRFTWGDVSKFVAAATAIAGVALAAVKL